MPTYRIRSGNMDERVTVPYHAQPTAIFFMALRQMMDSPVKSLGRLAEISGGKYNGDNAVYVSPERLMIEAGLLSPNEPPAGEGEKGRADTP